MSESQEYAGWTHVYSGKVRDLYVPSKLMTDDDSWTCLLYTSPSPRDS